MFTIIGADQKQYGPVSADEVREWIREGRADGRTLAKPEGSDEWKPLSAIPEFAEYTAASGVPPRLPSAPPYAAPQPDNRSMLAFADQRDFQIGECLRQGWRLVMENFGFLSSVTFIIWFLDLIVKFIPVANMFLGGALYGGLYLVYLRRIRNQPVAVVEVFTGFGVPFVQLLMAGFLTSLLTALACCACVFPGIYLKIAWTFALVLVIDKRLEFWSAMELSRRVATRVWLKLFVLTLIVFAPYLIFQAYVYIKIDMQTYPAMAALTSGNGLPDFTKMLEKMTEMMKTLAPVLQYLMFIGQAILLFCLPFAIGTLMYAYEALFGTRPKTAP